MYLDRASFEYIDISEIIKDLKKKHFLKPTEELNSVIQASFKNGVLYKGVKIDVLERESYNGITKKNHTRYHFKCPNCGKRVNKLYSRFNFLGCINCADIKPLRKKDSSSNLIMSIHSELSLLFNTQHRISKKKRTALIQSMVTQFKNLKEEYRIIYNSLLFQELIGWCSCQVSSCSRSSEYKNAMRDVLKILKDARKLLILWGLGKSRFRKLEI